jgi:beta-lactamase class D
MKFWLAGLCIFAWVSAQADDWVDSPEIAALFQAAGIEGTFVMFDIYRHELTGYNAARADYRYPPAATFKIPHTLIGLSTGAVASLDEVLPFGGQEQVYDSWERDMSLRQAMAASNPAIFETLARRIGPGQMQQHISALIYGNREFGSTMRPFWHEGPLQISAVEQVRFLSMLIRDALPYPRAMLKAVRDLILIEQGEGWALYGKAGWENVPEVGIGWWVGWIETNDKLYPFALNMDIRDSSAAAVREQLGRRSLQVLGLMP